MFSADHSIGRMWAGTEVLAKADTIRQLRDRAFYHVSDELDKITSVTRPSLPKRFIPIPVKRRFNPDEQIGAFRAIVQHSLGENADVGLLKSMMPTVVPATQTAPGCTTIEIDWIIDRIRWRMKMATKFNLTLEVFRDERLDINSKADDLAILQAFRADVVPLRVPEGSPDAGASDLKQSEIIERLEDIQQGVSDSVEVGRQTNILVQAFIPPRPSDYECSEKNLEQILTRLNVKRTVRQIRRWEDYIRTSGEEGTKPPSGYTLQTRLTLASATAWAEAFAVKEKAKLRTKTYLNEATATRYGTPAKRT